MNTDRLLLIGALALGFIALTRQQRAPVAGAAGGFTILPSFPAPMAPCILDPTTGDCLTWEIPQQILPAYTEHRRAERAADPCRALCGGDPSCEAVCGPTV